MLKKDPSLSAKPTALQDMSGRRCYKRRVFGMVLVDAFDVIDERQIMRRFVTLSFSSKPSRNPRKIVNPRQGA